jgi:hypothetical protein
MNIYFSCFSGVVLTGAAGSPPKRGRESQARHNVGGFLALNNDDDNANGIPDKDEMSVTGENDLNTVTLSMNPSPGDEGFLVLESSSNSVRLWLNATKTQSADPASPQTPTSKAKWRSSAAPSTVYIEGTAASAAVRDIVLTLRYVGHGAVIEDKARLTAIQANITTPTLNKDHDYCARSDYNETTVSLNANLIPSGSYAGLTTPTIAWNLTLEYKTSGGGFSTSAQRSAQSAAGQTKIETYNSQGGRAVCKASTSFQGCSLSNATTITVTGVSIPDDTITSRLVNLYDGPTTELLCAICWNESTYMQFSNPMTLYGRSDRWPRECLANPESDTKAGDYIGLMQVPVSMSTAWNWRENTSLGAEVYLGKLNMADNYQTIQQTLHEGLRCFTGIERENYALSKYAGYTNPLYIYNGDDSDPDWIASSNTGGWTYVNQIRQIVQTRSYD